MAERVRYAPSSERNRPPTITLVGRVKHGDAPELCERVRAAAPAHEGGTIPCDVHALVRPDIGTVGALARMALVSRRLGCELGLRRTRQELVELLALTGLDVLAVEVVGQPEEREEALGVEEERDPGDPIA